MRWTIAMLSVASLAAAPAIAAQWGKVTANKKGAVVYVDYAAIVRDGSKVTAPVKWDYTAVESEKNPIEVDNMVFDCAAKTFSMIDFTYYDTDGKVARKGKGPVLGMVAVPDPSIAKEIFDALCRNDT